MGDMSGWQREDMGDDDFDESQEMIKFKVLECEHETAAAWLLRLNGGAKEWFPKSRCDFDPAVMILEVPRWLAEKKRLD